ncbi:elongation factor P maturation arginine rhamnosyltransferase EarP [Lampropedia aestuarii]|uniref:Protein-arginine rhamnosyltransferase n=1 Tax=Lampropedia aestuarii TaxID=2562762 RepID=A0A4S5BT97_9BURK|nr:elongation factor P maturation arginine rhamnosyltransferase EarP [Lampropedia aestuarii]THJ35649.1 elongation factor P maturation arginine rhamnosyltransferase EarP [Lampropedia aestuarii]
MQWDVFCQVIDNYGDAGVCWRLADNLAQRGERVRLWIDDPAPLCWMSAEINQAKQQALNLQPAIAGDWLDGAGVTVGAQRAIQIMPWASAQRSDLRQFLQAMPRPDVVVEAFGCEIPHAYLEALAESAASAEAGAAPPAQPWPQWLNLEYLSAESYVERMHLLQSPVMFGPAQGQSKTFFYPGFTAKTGGLLREPQLLQAQAQFDRQQWRSQHFPVLPAVQAKAGQAGTEALWISLFAYEPECLQDWLQQWAAGAQPVVLLAMAGRSQEHLQACWAALGWAGAMQPTSGLATQQLQHGQLTVFTLAHVSQAEFDQVLWASDCNIVRGEDSLVRALWAGQPFLWHIYPQDDHAHHAKLDAFLDWLQVPGAWRDAMYQLNGITPATTSGALHEASRQSPGDWPSAKALAQWQTCAQQAKSKLLEREDLASTLRGYVQARVAPR